MNAHQRIRVDQEVRGAEADPQADVLQDKGLVLIRVAEREEGRAAGEDAAVGHDVAGHEAELVVLLEDGLAEVDVIKSGQAGSDAAVLVGEIARPDPRHVQLFFGKFEQRLSQCVHQAGINGELGAVDDLRILGDGDIGADGLDQSVPDNEVPLFDGRTGQGDDPGVLDSPDAVQVLFGTKGKPGEKEQGYGEKKQAIAGMPASGLLSSGGRHKGFLFYEYLREMQNNGSEGQRISGRSGRVGRP